MSLSSGAYGEIKIEYCTKKGDKFTVIEQVCIYASLSRTIMILVPWNDMGQTHIMYLNTGNYTMYLVASVE